MKFSIIDAVLAALLSVLSIGCTDHPQESRSMNQAASYRDDAGGLEGLAATERHIDDDLIQGRTRSRGLLIDWRGNTSQGVDALDVINSTIARIQFEQKTDLASDSNARALAHLMMARQELEGKTTTTEDGLPILE